MPTFVDPSKCDGCKGGEKTACMYICPNDLMILGVIETCAIFALVFSIMAM